MSKPRKIIHCDCDCFYASIETRDNPELAGKPLAVGGSPQLRGVIATCNYEARKFGIHSAMSSALARQRCPNLIIIRPDMEKYRLVSRQIHEIFSQYTDLIEPLSLDEAYLDVSVSEDHDGIASKIAESVRATVRSKVGITISAGIAPNKFIAKIASDWNKPDGQFVVKPEQVDSFVAALPVSKLHGVGKVTAAQMHRLGIESCLDLRALPHQDLNKYFGNFGNRLKELAWGVDERPVQVERIRKSLSVENTYSSDLPDLDSCLSELPALRRQLLRRLEKISADYVIQKQFVKIKFHDFVQTTAEMQAETYDLLNYEKLCRQGFSRGNRPARLLGLGVRLAPKFADRQQARSIQLALEFDSP